MKFKYHFTLPGLLLTTLFISPGYAEDFDPANDQVNKNTKDLSVYLLNLGKYLGYDLKDAPPQTPPPAENASLLTRSTTAQLLTDPNDAQQKTIPFYSVAFDVLLGAIPVNSLFSTFISSKGDNSLADTVNAFANTTFLNYDKPDSSDGVSVNRAVDVPKEGPYQKDPVSQALLNILSTPDFTYCMEFPLGGPANFPTGWDPKDPKDCTFMTELRVKDNVIGELPPSDKYFTAEYNQAFLSQLNSNNLIAPLLYATEAPDQNPTGSPSPNKDNKRTLTAQSQAQQAANFIRYATSAVAPLPLPKRGDYAELLAKANSKDPSQFAEKVQAHDMLATYLTKLRVYAAQLSVGYSNLYYMLSKRLPQDMKDAPPTSQALNEFTMATWRLYNPKGGQQSDWLNQINHASSIALQKEMVTLLAEINYQMYLSRQQEERLLLTNTMILMVGSNMAQPNAPLVANIVSQR